MNSPPDIVICLGSSCFSRGNRNIKEIISQYLKENGLEGKVVFRGNRCFDNCARGPVVKIGEQVFYEVNELNIMEILRKHVK